MLFWINILHTVMIAAVFLSILFIANQTPSRTQNILLIMTISVLVLMVGYTLELNATTRQAALVGVKIGYLGKPFAILAAFLFVLDRYGYSALFPKFFKHILVALSTLITMLVLTCEYNTLYYTSIAFVSNRDFIPHLVLGHGPFYFVYMGLIFFYMIGDSVILIREFRRAKNFYEKQQLLLVFGLIASGVIGFIVFLTGITGGYDSTLLGTFVGCVFLIVLFFKYRIFDALEVVKEHALKASGNGIIVLDMSDRIVYTNRIVQDIFPEILENESETPIYQLRFLVKGRRILKWGGKYYKAIEAPVMENGRIYGSSLELQDVTDNYLYSQRLEQAVSDRTKDIHRIQRKVTVGFANIVEARDGDTGSHIKRTSYFVSIIAKALKENSPYSSEITDEFITRLEETAPLHDVGKIHISDSILLKPGKLTAEEFELMKTHTTLGKDLIEQTMHGVESDEYVTMAEDIAMYHHERWDGKGYPCGLSRNQIPLSARIMSIADVYDALRSKRCYKKAFSKEESYAIVYEEMGRQFDPIVAKAFLDNIDKAERILQDQY